MGKDTAGGAAAEMQTDRQRLIEALKANPKNASAHVKLAQVEARAWGQSKDPTVLAKVVDHLEQALETLPEAQRPKIGMFCSQLQQRGADVKALVGSGSHPRLMALMSSPSGSQNAQPKAAPAAAPQASPVQASAPAHTAAPKAQPTKAGKRGGMKFKEADVGDASNAAIKGWLTGNKLSELASAYPVVDNFRTRRLIIDKVAETSSPLAVSALVFILAHEHDDTSINYIMKKILALDGALLDEELSYDSSDRKYKAAVVQILANRRTESCVEPLSRALSDPDAALRLQAITALTASVGAEADWIRQLGFIVTKDRDQKVRYEAARSLQSIDTADALRELELASKASDFDTTLAGIYETMQGKFAEIIKEKQREDAAKRRKEKKKDQFSESEGFASGFKFNPMEIFKLLIVVALFSFAIVWAWTQIGKFRPGELDHPVEMQESDAPSQAEQEAMGLIPPSGSDAPPPVPPL